MTSHETYPAVFATLLAAHQVADHWIQTDRQAQHKGRRDWAGRRACAAHVGTYTLVGAVALGVTKAATRMPLSARGSVTALAISAVSHYWIDRRFTLAGVAERCGKGNFYRLGAPRPGRDDNPGLGTGAYALDQAAHVGMLWIASLAAALIGRKVHSGTSGATSGQ
jgi:hypothetical protein